jgi:hypothetical protein
MRRAQYATHLAVNGQPACRFLGPLPIAVLVHVPPGADRARRGGRAAGASVVVEHASTCVVHGMPRAIAEAGASPMHSWRCPTSPRRSSSASELRPRRE